MPTEPGMSQVPSVPAVRRAPAKLRLVLPGEDAVLGSVLATFPWEGISAMSWPDRLRHWWADNPALPAGEAAWQPGWVIEDEGRIVGFLGSVPRLVSVDGESRLSANATTWWVAPTHRKYSLQLLARFTAQTAAGHFNTTAAPSTHQAMEAFGYTLFPTPDGNQESFLLVDPARVAAAKIEARVATSSLSRFAPASRLIHLLAPLGSQVQKLRLPKVQGAYHWDEMARADDRFDALDRTFRARHRFTAQRDSISINWYLNGESAERKVLVGCRQGTRLVGYGLFLQRDSGSLAGLPILDCIDLVLGADEPGILATILAGIGDIARRRAVAAIVVRHYDGFVGRCCREFRLITRVGPARREYVKFPSGVDGGVSYLTQFHGDFII